MLRGRPPFGVRGALGGWRGPTVAQQERVAVERPESHYWLRGFARALGTGGWVQWRNVYSVSPLFYSVEQINSLLGAHSPVRVLRLIRSW